MSVNYRVCGIPYISYNVFLTKTLSSQFVTAPIRLSTACRQINEALTGPKAQKRRHINEAALKGSWEMLAACWDEFEGLRELSLGGIMQKEDMERFVSGWQVRSLRPALSPPSFLLTMIWTI